MSAANGIAAPTGATQAVLKPSEPVPEGSRQVHGIDFNRHAGRSITVEELVAGYASMGFQATAVGDAVRIINAMVSFPREPACACVGVQCGECACFGSRPCAAVPK